MRFGGAKTPFTVLEGLPRWLSCKESASNAEPQETWVRYLGWADPLEKEMAIYSSILPLENPTDRGTWWLRSIGSQRVGHD